MYVYEVRVIEYTRSRTRRRGGSWEGPGSAGAREDRVMDSCCKAPTLGRLPNVTFCPLGFHSLKTIVLYILRTLTLLMSGIVSEQREYRYYT